MDCIDAAAFTPRWSPCISVAAMHVVMIPDQADWHGACDLRAPDTITPDRRQPIRPSSTRSSASASTSRSASSRTAYFAQGSWHGRGLPSCRNHPLPSSVSPTAPASADQRRTTLGPKPERLKGRT
jgi:hypothetical protein